MPPDPETRRVFISYRRDDSAYPAQTINDALVSRFGKEAVFFDRDSIPIGADFHDFLNDAVSKCDLLLAVIGDHWLTARDAAGARRLDNPDDFVWIEVEAALSRGIPVVPVLVGRANVPRPQDLPPTLVGLSRRQATEVRAGADFHLHLKRLVQGVERLFDMRSSQPVSVDLEPAEPSPAAARNTTVTTPASETTNLPQQITNSIGMKLALIPAGGFMMGSPEDEAGRKGDEDQHRVRITKPFYLGVYQVTQAEYEQVMGTNPSTFNSVSGMDTSRFPVDSVSWDDAVEFCRRLSSSAEEQSVGRVYRLPTEAEWEYACRAGTTTRYSFGDNDARLGEFARFRGNERGQGHPVGEKQANAWGLHDMHGNVWEWCEDWYGDYRGSPVDDPPGASVAAYRVIRGGCWRDDAGDCRAAIRDRDEPRDRYVLLGFRVAASPSSQSSQVPAK